MFELDLILKKKIKISFGFYLLVLLIVSCKDDLGTPIEIVLPKEKSKLVVSSLFSPWDSTENKPFYVEVLKTTTISDTTADEAVENAVVLLFEGEELLDTLNYDTLANKYLFLHTPEVDSEYSIVVSKAGFNTVTAKNYVPPKVKINNFSIIPFAGKNNNSTSTLPNVFGVFSKVSIEYTDPIDVANFYEIAIKIIGEKEYEKIYTYEDIIINEAYYPSELSIGFKNPDYLPFNDRLINGKTLRLDIFYDAPTWWDGTMYIGEHTLQIHLRSVTEEYYKYRTTLLQHVYNQKDDIIFGMAEPLNAYSNIENGYGVFVGYNEDVVEIQIDEMKLN